MYFRKNLKGGVNLLLDDKFKFAFYSAVFSVGVMIFYATPVFAEEGTPTKAPIIDTGTVEIGDAQTQLIVDKENNIIRIMIEGKEVGSFDKNGFHVVGDVDYTGTLTDVGSRVTP